jgi:mannose-6-phosphate isomerase-like protein (cupin superfamily)
VDILTLLKTADIDRLQEMIYSYLSMEGLSHYEKENRPWGNFERFTHNEASTVKILTVKAGQAFSLQTHERRDEFWQVIGGSGIIRVGEKDNDAVTGGTFYIPRHTMHRATGGTTDLIILEIAFGDADENDIKRFEDKYGRT